MQMKAKQPKRNSIISELKVKKLQSGIIDNFEDSKNICESSWKKNYFKEL